MLADVRMSYQRSTTGMGCEEKELHQYLQGAYESCHGTLLLLAVQAQTAAMQVIKFSPDGRWLCSGAEDGTVKLWDLAAGKLMQNFTAHEV